MDTLVPWLIGAAVGGALVGSFLNVVIHRLPRMLERQWQRECAEIAGNDLSDEQPTPFDLAQPRSHCPACGHTLRAWENVPLLSYLLLRGRCSACRSPIGLRYPLVEGLAALLALVLVWRFGPEARAWAGLALTWSLIALAFIDFDVKLLPDSITLPLLWAGLLLSLGSWFTDPTSAIIGAATGYLVLWGAYQAFRLLTGKEGMGYGDFKLLGVLGAWLGWQMLPQIVLISALCGSLVGIGLILWRGRSKDIPIPFGPYLAIAGWIAMLWGHEINAWYLRWSGLG
jgi:leader peptidase (prepilin peptidase)/N-methyltransferase